MIFPQLLKNKTFKNYTGLFKIKAQSEGQNCFTLNKSFINIVEKTVYEYCTVCARTQTVHKYVLTVYEFCLRVFGTTNCVWVCVGNANCLWVWVGKQTVYEYVQGTQTEYVSGTQTVYEYEVRTRTVYKYVLGPQTVYEYVLGTQTVC